MKTDTNYIFGFKAVFCNGAQACSRLDMERRIGRKLYKICYTHSINLYESSVQWIENNISKCSPTRNIFWKIDDSNTNNLPYAIAFFENFIDKPGIPSDVNRALIFFVGYSRALYETYIVVNEPLPLYHWFFIEHWLGREY